VSQRLPKYAPLLAVLLVITYWLATGGISAIQWALVGSLQQQPASFSLMEKAHFSLGMTFSQTDPQWAVAGGGEPPIFAVFDQAARLIRTFDSEGRPLAAFGERGMLEGQFLQPAGLAIDHKGHIAVADRRLPVIRFFTAMGEPAGCTPAVQDVRGWGDVAFGPSGMLAASPEPVSGLHGAGVYLFSDAQDGQQRVDAIGEQCFGPLTVDGEGNIYVVNLSQQLEGRSRQYLLGLSPQGKRLCLKRINDNRLKSDLTYWAAVDRLIMVNYGARRIEAISMNDLTISTILETDPAKAPPVAVVPIQESLYVVFGDGDVIVYDLAD